MRITITNGPSKPDTMPICDLRKLTAEPGVYTLAGWEEAPQTLWIVEPNRRDGSVIEATVFGPGGGRICLADFNDGDKSQMVRLGNVEAEFRIIPD